jgi:uncharacterized protein
MEEKFYSIAKPILENEEFQKRKNYAHHGNISVYDHSLKVAHVAFKICKFLRIKNEKNVIVAALLHDFYDKPWQDSKEKKPFLKKHGFVHAHEALLNAQKHFPNLMNKRIENAIERHMFPLNKIPPKYKEGWIVTISDKIVSMEVLIQPTFLKKLLGFRGEK